MEPSGPTSGIPLPLINRPQPVSPPLQVGQRLLATVLENSAGKILLSLGNRQLSAESSLPFKPGQVLTVQVRSLGEQPVLKVIAALQESATAMAVRMLLPRYGPTTPLLASLPLLATTPDSPLPAPVSNIVRVLVQNLPEVAALSTPEGVRAAIRNSGGFLEHHLTLAATAQASSQKAVPVSFDADFKVNLLRLLQLVRNWPGGDRGVTATTSQQPDSRPAASGPATPGPPPSSTEFAAGRPVTPSPGEPTTDSPARSAGTAPSQPAPAAQPSTSQRAIEAAGTPPPPRAAALPGDTGAPATSAGVAPAVNAPASGSLNPAPPFTGVVPAPQTPAQVTIDLLNRFGHLRTDLLQQTEAALARIHLNQLASLPREAEQRLVEWLFDIPVRRGDTIDLWSARVYRDADGETRERDRPATQWHVQLAFDLPGLGPVQAQINLQGERVSAHFWAAEPQTLPLLREHLHELRRGMLAAGLAVGDIDCRQGAIAGSAKGPGNPLIDETA